VQVAYEDGDAPDLAEREAEYSRREQIFELYRRVAVSFAHFLLERPEGKPALDYLSSRSIGADMIARFRLGYAPADRKWLYRFLLGKGYSPEFLDGSGLFSSSHKGMAFFRDRLMFPIADRQGRTVAFGGRALPGAAQIDGRDPPKYVNTRETDAYKKGQILYGLDLALPEMRRTKAVCVAEGYMDVIALHQAGVANAVAPCGTAFTDEQARLLRNWAEGATLAFDADDAGMKAAVKGIVTCRKNGLACSLVAHGNAAEGGETSDMPSDPADILQKFGPEALNLAMKNVIIDLEYLIARGKRLYDTSIPQGKAEALAAFYPYFDALGSQTERNACMEAVADALRADRESVRADYARSRKASAEREQAGREEAPYRSKAIRMNDELYLLTLVSVNENMYAEFRASVEMREIEDPAAKELFVALEECFMNGETGADALLSRISWDKLREFVAERGVSPEFRAGAACNPERLMRDGVKRIRAKWLRRRLSEIGSELRVMERNSGADMDFDGLIAEKMRLDVEIRELEYADGKVGK